MSPGFLRARFWLPSVRRGWETDSARSVSSAFSPSMQESGIPAWKIVTLGGCFLCADVDESTAGRPGPL